MVVRKYSFYKNRLLASFLLIIFTLFGMSSQVLALTDDQIRALQSGVYYFNTEAGSTTTQGSAEGCISGKLPTITDETAFASAMTTYVQNHYGSSPFLQIPTFGKIMVDRGKATGVNPMIVIAIGAQETGMGSDGVGSGMKLGSHNAFGMTAGQGQPGVTVGNFTWLVFPSFEASLTQDDGVFGRLQNEGYVNDPSVGTFNRIIAKWLTGNPNGADDGYGNSSKDYIVHATQTINDIASQPNSGVDCSAGGSANGSKIVSVAQAELALGVHEQPDGSNCLPSVNNKYMDGICQSWCANFVSWVYMTAGVPFTGGLSGGWRIPAVPGLVDWFKANGKWYDNSPGTSAPQPGDVIIFSYSGGNADTSGSLDHTGIIETVSGTTITTIEGNASNSVKQNSYTNYPSSNTIVGWGRLK